MKSILENKKDEETIEELYLRTKDVFYDASEFLNALDILFVLSIIDVNYDTGVIVKYA